MKLEGAKKTKTGYSTSVEVLEKIEHLYPIIPMILEYRQLTKLKSTYADGLANFIQDDQRIHGKFNQTNHSDRENQQYGTKSSEYSNPYGTWKSNP